VIKEISYQEECTFRNRFKCSAADIRNKAIYLRVSEILWANVYIGTKKLISLERYFRLDCFISLTYLGRFTTMAIDHSAHPWEKF
jgi:hypothetical protein